MHGIEGPDSDSPVPVGDALRADPGERFDMMLTNPPFGKKSSVQMVNAEGKAERQSVRVRRDDCWASTSNEHLDFVQHVKTLLKVQGRASPALTSRTPTACRFPGSSPPRSPKTVVRLTFAEIKRVVGDGLPPSARKHQAFGPTSQPVACTAMPDRGWTPAIERRISASTRRRFSRLE